MENSVAPKALLITKIFAKFLFFNAEYAENEH
jgi:hypothetical protein